MTSSQAEANVRRLYGLTVLFGILGAIAYYVAQRFSPRLSPSAGRGHLAWQSVALQLSVGGDSSINVGVQALGGARLHQPLPDPAGGRLCYN